MDPLFLSTKRAHWICVRYGLPLLAKHGLTPARFDVLRDIYERPGMCADQAWVRKVMGVARSTASRMFRTLEKLGLMTRERSRMDRRTLTCTLTDEGKRRVAAALHELVWSKIVAKVVEAALSLAGTHPCDVRVEREVAEFMLHRMRLLLYFSRVNQGQLNVPDIFCVDES
jgi:DNA-binding MarR family transcriptional regulator